MPSHVPVPSPVPSAVPVPSPVPSAVPVPSPVPSPVPVPACLPRRTRVEPKCWECYEITTLLPSNGCNQCNAILWLAQGREMQMYDQAIV